MRAARSRLAANPTLLALTCSLTRSSANPFTRASEPSVLALSEIRTSSPTVWASTLFNVNPRYFS